MGYFPIFVALSGFIFLYTIYTLNQIKPKKAAFALIIDLMAKLSSERKNLIISYHESNNDSPLNAVALDLKKASTDRFQSFKKENDLIAKTNEGANKLDSTHQGLKQKIIELNIKQESFLKLLKSKSDQYNRFIQKAPTKFIALIFGFKAF